MRNPLTYQQAKGFIKQRLMALDVEYGESVSRKSNKLICRFVPHSLLPNLRLTLTEDTGAISFGFENEKGKLEHFKRKSVDEHAIMAIFDSALSYHGALRRPTVNGLPLRPIPAEPHFQFDSEGVIVRITPAQARDPEVMAAVYLLIDTIKESAHA